MRTILLLGSICSFILAASSSVDATYSDNFARTKMLPLSSAAYSTAPQNCLTNRFTSAVLRRQLTVKCDSSRIDECSGFTAVLNADKAIVISFRGTDNFLQLIKESDNTLFKSQDAWIAGGKVSTYFNKAFMSLWNGGMKGDFNTLRSKYPSYQIWVTGHSLGGAMATLAASYIVAAKLVPASVVQLVTFGQPRTGNKNFSAAHDAQALASSFRVTHSRDVVPHVPPKELQGYYHHKFEEIVQGGWSTLRVLRRGFLTVTKKDEKMNWGLMRAQIMSTIPNFIESGKPVISEGSAPEYSDTEMRTILIFGCICSFILAAPSSVDATYSDNFARTKMLPLSSAAYSTAPQNCLTNRFTSAVLRRQLTVKCDSTRSDKCSGYTAVLNADKAIVISFRGTDSFLQLVEESDNTVFKSQTAWIAGGKVSTYFNSGFISLWNGGMKDDFNALRSKYPSYQIWVTGHSLGGAMATLAASYIVAAKLVPASDVQLVTFGQPRTGNKDFSAAHDAQALASSYRVTHWRDVVPHVPPEDLEGYYHHKFETFYHNDMKNGATFKTCTGDEDKGCSDGLDITISISDHLHYFDKDVSGYGESGCK